MGIYVGADGKIGVWPPLERLAFTNMEYLFISYHGKW
jgi:hypothetical protein